MSSNAKWLWGASSAGIIIDKMSTSLVGVVGGVLISRNGLRNSTSLFRYSPGASVRLPGVAEVKPV